MKTKAPFFLETDQNWDLRFRPKAKATPEMEAYFRPEAETKRN